MPTYGAYFQNRGNPLVKNRLLVPRQTRRITALAFWGAGIALLVLCGWWNVLAVRQAASDRLIAEAGRTASQLAGLLSIPAWEPDERTARDITLAAMEKDHDIYAIRILTPRRTLEGQRRDGHDLVPWDDEIAEGAAKGESSIRLEDRLVGTVEIYLSGASVNKEIAAVARRETLRAVLGGLFLTAALFVLLWYWDDFGAFRKLLASRGAPVRKKEGRTGEKDSVIGAAANASAGKDPARNEEGSSLPDRAGAREGGEAAPAVVDASLGRRYLRKDAAWCVTAVLFREIFAEAPALMSRLHAAGELAALCRLGRTLEQAAPCLGAERLSMAAADMQTVLNDPQTEAPSLAVEECIRALEEVLDALGGE